MNELEPFCSIIVPTYNRPAQLQACLESIACLDYPVNRFEVIIVDDGSRISLGSVVSPFRNKMAITLLSQQNSGPGVARNRGAMRAKGQLLVFTDDDCRPSMSWLTHLARRFSKTPDRAIGGSTLNALSENVYSITSHAIMEYVYAYYNEDPNSARFFASNNLAVPADLFNAIGGFDGGWPLVAAEDRELCERWLFQGHKLFYAPEAIVYHAHSLTFRTFCRQHLNYGRGSFRFHETRARHGQGRFKLELRFYTALCKYPFLKHGVRVVPLLVLWQCVNTAGFLWEMLAARLKSLGGL